MNEAKGVRWRQRLQNFELAFERLTVATERFEELSDLERDGLVHRFEYTFELAWKTLKDYLESQDVVVKFPRDVVRQAFHFELITDGDVWMDMFEKRNLIANTYDEDDSRQAVELIGCTFYPAVRQVFEELKTK